MRIFAAILVLLLAACDDADDGSIHITAVGDLTPEQGEIVQRAADAFAAACPNLFTRFAKDVESATLSVTENDEATRAIDHMYGEYGWDRYVYVAVKIIDRPSQIPNSMRAGGHTLHYFLGGGRVPGARSIKAQAQLVCGWPPAQEGDVHIPIAALSIIDSL